MKVIGMKKIILGSIAGAVVGAAALAAGLFAGTSHQSAPVASVAAPASTDMSQQAVENIVRNYLLKNPEIMIEVQTALETKQAETAQAQIKDVLATSRTNFTIRPTMPFWKSER